MSKMMSLNKLLSRNAVKKLGDSIPLGKGHRVKLEIVGKIFYVDVFRL